jgi:hypothetical protein
MIYAGLFITETFYEKILLNRIIQRKLYEEFSSKIEPIRIEFCSIRTELVFSMNIIKQIIELYH